jgi:hypothetical protein
VRHNCREVEFTLFRAAESGTNRAMLHDFNRSLRREVRRAEWLARSPQAFARRLLSARFLERRLRVILMLQLAEGVDRGVADALVARLRRAAEVRWVSEIGAGDEVLLMLDCASRDALADCTETLLVANPTVRRYESFLIKRELRFAPFARLGSQV